jgi:hypothetical protein
MGHGQNQPDVAPSIFFALVAEPVVAVVEKELVPQIERAVLEVAVADGQ